MMNQTLAQTFTNEELITMYNFLCVTLNVAESHEICDLLEETKELGMLRRPVAMTFLASGYFQETFNRGMQFGLPALKDFLQNCKEISIHKRRWHLFTYKWTPEGDVQEYVKVRV